MPITVLPGSALLQAFFYAIAAAVIAGGVGLVSRATAGDARAPAVRRRFIAGATAWVAIVSGASYAGILIPRTGPPLPFLLLIVGVIILGVVIARSTAGELMARNVPLAVLVGFQAFRFPLELAMHRAFAEGLMPEQMTYTGRNFDIVSGVTALLVAALLLTGIANRMLVYAWNVMGLLLLINVVAIAVASSPVFAAFGRDRLNVWVTWMPYTLLPAVMVLAAWAGHLVIFRALRRA